MGTGIMQNGRYCYLCGTYKEPFELHHCMNGRPNRQLSDKYGLVVYLCPTCHRLVHAEIELRLQLKQEAQRTAMHYYDWNFDDWRERFGKNYL